MPTPSDLITLNAPQIEAGAHVLARAFQHDPLMLHVLPDTLKRQRLLPILFRIVVRYCLRYGVIYAAPSLEGLICCLPPGQTTSISRLALVSLSHPPLQLGLTALRRFLRASNTADQARDQVAPGAHWYIWALGVDPTFQEHGFGGRLVRTVLQQAGAQRLPCYLDTENPRNVTFYQQYGFRQARESAIAGSAVHVYAMLWEPEEA
jgi:GNAT superfamily N-acetyltransferase